MQIPAKITTITAGDDGHLSKRVKVQGMTFGSSLVWISVFCIRTAADRTDSKKKKQLQCLKHHNKPGDAELKKVKGHTLTPQLQLPQSFAVRIIQSESFRLCSQAAEITGLSLWEIQYDEILMSQLYMAPFPWQQTLRFMGTVVFKLQKLDSVLEWSIR